MNKARRTDLNKLHELLADIYGTLEYLREQEADAYDNLPESLQGSEKGEAMEEARDNLDEAMEALGDCMDYILDAAER